VEKECLEQTPLYKRRRERTKRIRETSPKYGGHFDFFVGPGSEKSCGKKKGTISVIHHRQLTSHQLRRKGGGGTFIMPERKGVKRKNVAAFGGKKGGILSFGRRSNSKETTASSIPLLKRRREEKKRTLWTDREVTVLRQREVYYLLQELKTAYVGSRVQRRRSRNKGENRSWEGGLA